MNRLSMFIFTAVCLSLSVVSVTFAGDTKPEAMEQMKPYTGSAEFEQVKVLEGTWTGSGMMHGQENPVSVIYKTTSNGSAIVETLFPGMPHEMVSIYYDQDGKLTMMHFCSLGNQPVLQLTDSVDDSFTLDLVGGTNMDASKDMHMHKVTFTFDGENEMVQDWTPYTDGKPDSMATSLKLTRQN